MKDILLIIGGVYTLEMQLWGGRQFLVDKAGWMKNLSPRQASDWFLHRNWYGATRAESRKMSVRDAGWEWWDGMIGAKRWPHHHRGVHNWGIRGMGWGAVGLGGTMALPYLVGLSILIQAIETCSDWCLRSLDVLMLDEASQTCPIWPPSV